MAAIPNLAPLVLVRRRWRSTGIPLYTLKTLTRGAEIGRAVDDTIHLMKSFRRYDPQSRNVGMAVREPLPPIGQARFFTSLVRSERPLPLLARDDAALQLRTAERFTLIAAFLINLLHAPARMMQVTHRSTGSNTPFPLEASP